MSNEKTPPSGKNFNPMHTSFIMPRSQLSFSAKQTTNPLKLSQFYTKATSEFDCTEDQNQSHLISKYQSRIKNLESGYQRSKQQYENSIKSMYREKMILLNIISHNQVLVDEFRNKLKTSVGSFKEIETKYNIVVSGLFHNQLCSSCVLSLCNTDFQSKSTEKGKEATTSSGKKQKSNKRCHGLAKQYSWMYVPNAQSASTIKLKLEINKLKINIDQVTHDYSKKISEKNREIEQLKSQGTKLQLPFHTIATSSISNPDKSQEICEKPTPKLKEKVKQLQTELSHANSNKQRVQSLLKESNERLFAEQLQKLNSKYKNKIF